MFTIPERLQDLNKHFGLQVKHSKSISMYLIIVASNSGFFFVIEECEYGLMAYAIKFCWRCSTYFPRFGIEKRSCKDWREGRIFAIACVCQPARTRPSHLWKICNSVYRLDNWRMFSILTGLVTPQSVVALEWTKRALHALYALATVAHQCA